MKFAPLLLSAFMVSQLSADEIGDKLTKLQAEISAEVKNDVPAGEKPEQRMQREQRNQQLMMTIVSIERIAASDQHEQPENFGSALGSNLTPALRDRIAAFVKELPALQKARQEAYRKEVEGQLAAAKKAVPEAKEADVLNGLAGELDALRMFQRHSDSPLKRQTAEQLSEAVQTIGKWQEYLRNRDAGYLEAARNSLQQLLEQRFEYPLLNAEVIRSALGKLETQESDPANEVAAILKSVQKISDIPSAAQSVSKIPPSRNDYDGLQGVSQRMRNYATVYAAFQYGSPENQGFSSSGLNSSSPLTPELLRIENLLRLDILERAYAPLNVGPPKEGENHQSYTARLIETAAKNKDWPGLEKILLFFAKGISRQSDPLTTAQLSALQAFNAAKRYEAAAQYAQAIQSYRKVLASTTPNVPVDEATERLKVLSAEHKEAIAQADRDDEIRAIVRSAMESSVRRPPGAPY